ncbi:hypothetical protein B6J19_12525 [Klebsiella quasipneumoniae]|nr:hypothetical protein B6J19_12525 [Klebsiella quasipneumoniae]
MSSGVGEPFSSPKVVHYLFHTASLLAALAHPCQIVNYAAGDVLNCRLDAARNILCTFHCK